MRRLDDRPYFSMELAVGSSLLTYRDRHHPLPFETHVMILRGVAAALTHLHESGVVHRDVKLSNVLPRQDTVG